MYKSSVGYSLTNKGFDSEVGFKVVRGFGVTPLVFSLQPQSKTVDEYLLATFNVVVTGGVEPYSYQWKKGGISVGTNSPSVSFSTAATDNGASITCVVTDSVGGVIASNAAVLGVTSYAFAYDGVSQKATLSSPLIIPASTDFKLEFYLKGTNSGALRPFGRGDNFTSRLFIGTPGDVGFFDASNTQYTSPIGTYSPYFGARTLFELSRVGSVMQIKANSNVIHTISSASSISFSINQLMSHSSNLFAAGNISNLSLTVGGVLAHKIPLNNKSQGANQLATVGSVNATIVNYNANGWVAI